MCRFYAQYKYLQPHFWLELLLTPRMMTLYTLCWITASLFQSLESNNWLTSIYLVQYIHSLAGNLIPSEPFQTDYWLLHSLIMKVVEINVENDAASSKESTAPLKWTSVDLSSLTGNTLWTIQLVLEYILSIDVPKSSIQKIWICISFMCSIPQEE